MIKPHASTKSHQYWLDMSRKYEASGLSKKALCEKEGINVKHRTDTQQR